MTKKKVITKKRSKARLKRIVKKALDPDLIWTENKAGKDFGYDPFMVKVISEEIERQHKLPVDNGLRRANWPFARDLSAALSVEVAGTSPEMAVDVWVKACARYAAKQKKTA